ncbi:ATP-dependent nuclease [Arenimonas malthae]|uniref:ATP-dependent nuclease n=1 Tax=Arenimonas malthae TaxID=354197 RepID=UPI000A03D9A7|nr:AAA family ATPase [Arenimonas malthae]
MKILGLDIKNFRSIASMRIDCGDLTPICGINSSGKSNVLRALRFAFLKDYDPAKVARNFPSFVNGPAALIRVSVRFDEPSIAASRLLGIPAGVPFEYEVNLKRSGAATYRVNGKAIQKADRDAFLDGVLIVYVPPIRDIAYDGLAPFKEMLARALRKAKKGKSFASLNKAVKAAVDAKGLEVLTKASGHAGMDGSLGILSVDSAAIDVEVLLSSASVQVEASGARVPLEMVGTGHQSQVVMGLFRQFGSSFPGLVVYVFEEPDNHLHPTALRAVANDLKSIGSDVGSQVFVSSHSPALLNQ